MLTQQTPVAFSGNIPSNYDSFLGPLFFEPYAIDLANRISKLNASSILEIASGTGRLTKMLPSVIAKGGSITASDINPSMVKFGQEQTKKESIKWMEIDAHSLPFEDKTFDCVVCQFGVMFYNDRIKAFKEAWRVLKPGGTFIFNAWDELNNNPMAKAASDTLKHFFPIDTPAFYTIPFSYYDENTIKNDLNQAGFNKTKIELVNLTGYSNSPTNAAKGLIEGTPTISAIQERDNEILPSLLEYLQKEIVKLFGSQTLKVPMQARVITAVKD